MAGRSGAAGTCSEDGAGAGRERAERPLRPAQCRAYMRRELAREFRGIVQGFVDSAKKGSCQHVKLAAELVQAPVRVRPKKSTVERLIEELERAEGPVE